MRLFQISVFVVAIAMTAAGGAVIAQDHSYTPADIENGGRLYQSKL